MLAETVAPFASFKTSSRIESKKKTIDGKERTYQEKIPISSYAVATHTDNTQGGGE